MSDPLSYKRSGITHRTSRDRARAHGAKVGALPQAAGYCSVHGMPHLDGRCATNQVDAEAEEVSRSGGANKAARTLTPFKLGG